MKDKKMWARYESKSITIFAFVFDSIQDFQHYIPGFRNYFIKK